MFGDSQILHQDKWIAPKAGRSGEKSGVQGGEQLEMLLWTLLLPLGLLSAALPSASQCGMEERSQRARRTVPESRSLRSAPEGSCATSLARGRRSLTSLEHLRLHHHHRHHHRREGHEGAAESMPPGRALYFTGHGDQLRLKAGNELPGDTFTLQVWLRAEGGQRSPAIIAGKCPIL